jgi:hypothetical protein
LKIRATNSSGTVILGGGVSMLKEREVRDRLSAYLDGAMPLREFSAWLYGESWHIEERSEPAARALVYEILGRVAERSTSGFSEEVLRESLLPLASNVILIQESPLDPRFGSSSDVVVLSVGRELDPAPP